MINVQLSYGFVFKMCMPANSFFHCVYVHAWVHELPLIKLSPVMFYLFGPLKLGLILWFKLFHASEI